MAAAVSAARRAGLDVVDPVVLRDGSNLLVRLDPFPVVARIATKTAAVREGGGLDWMRRDVEVRGWLAAQGAPVAPPSPIVDAGPHFIDGHHVTLAALVDHDPDALIDGVAAGVALREIHEWLASYPGDLRGGGLAAEVPGWLDRADRESLANPDDLAMLRSSAAKPVPDLPVQAVHGDAGVSNLLRTCRGLLWNDFEDSCVAPRHVDFASLVAGPRFFGSTPNVLDDIKRGYGEWPSDDELAPFVEARAVAAITWELVTRSPNLGRHLRTFREVVG